ncbi:hypothetical protein ACLBQD_32210, partial [Klebsiella pneumoniae]
SDSQRTKSMYAHTLKRFEQQCGCELVLEFYSGTEEMMAKLAAGASGYGVIIPTQNSVRASVHKSPPRSAST